MVLSREIEEHRSRERFLKGDRYLYMFIGCHGFVQRGFKSVLTN
jgi:hypothetical protein